MMLLFSVLIKVFGYNIFLLIIFNISGLYITFGISISLLLIIIIGLIKRLYFVVRVFLIIQIILVFCVLVIKETILQSGIIYMLWL